jgi:hypothetical protein
MIRITTVISSLFVAILCIALPFDSASFAQDASVCVPPLTAAAGVIGGIEDSSIIDEVRSTCTAGNIIELPLRNKVAVAAICDFEKQIVVISNREALCVVSKSIRSIKK